MEVKLINTMEASNVWKNWSNVASVCYDSKVKNPEVIAKHCLASGHFSGSRGTYFIFKITDCPRFVIDQAVRHETGVFKNVQSFRYVNKDNFSYEIPVEIQDNDELIKKYVEHMNSTIAIYDEINAYVLSKGKPKERANEQARYVLPMATHGAVCIGFTLEALIHYMSLRLCTRTEDVHRELANKIRKEVENWLPDVASLLVPQCDRLLYCPEAKCCGRHKKRDEVEAILIQNNL